MNWVPDAWMLRMQYLLHTGNVLHLQAPKRFTEKLQWYKLYYRDPVMQQCVNKHAVRNYVKQCGLEYILNECYGCFNSVDEIDINKLPKSFVVKDTLGGGGSSVIIVKDKAKTNLELLQGTIRKWTQKQTGKILKHVGREWVYENQRNQIVIERLIEPENEKRGVVDYKMHCFGGVVKVVDVAAYRKFGGFTPFVTLDADYNKLTVRYLNEDILNDIPAKPNNFDEMKAVAERLSERFPYVRVDLYNENSKILFGELTFFQASGYNKFDPDEFDYQLGEMFTLPQKSLIQSYHQSY